ncbi:hypothetical protein [Prevotella sp. P2-180]|uniref:hypothetical protein n=1 Tax=Prevotella sp. P2-180 TaxID=2024224 RepID=UPI00114039B9
MALTENTLMRLADTLLDKNKVLIEVKHFSIIMGIVNAYLPVEKLRNFLTSRKLFGMQYLLASLFGASNFFELAVTVAISLLKNFNV